MRRPLFMICSTPKVVIATIALLGVGCGGVGAENDAFGDGTDEGELRPTVVETRWTALSELFVEFPTLVVDETSRFAIHFTDLETFQPLRAGQATVRLTSVTSGDVREFAVETPGRPGIFGVDVSPERAGAYRLELSVDAPGLHDRHDLGDVRVWAEVDAIASTAPVDLPASDAISFLKEQQWVLDFATAAAPLQEVASSLLIAAEIEPRTGGQVDVATPVDGRVADTLIPHAIGSRVRRGETLAEVIPHSGHGEDRPALELAVAEANNALELARADGARVERLVEAGALPARRRLETRVAIRTANARVTAAEAHLAQLDATRTGEGDGAENVRFALRSPIGGVVAESEVTPGASVEAGTRLFQIVALDRVHVVGAVPEAELARLDDLAGAELQVPGFDRAVAIDRLVAVGRVLDPRARTVPITYELDDPDPRLAIGQAVSLRLFTSQAVAAVTVPESAVVDDGGQPIIFVQVGGESFERRVVQLGNRESGSVQISGDIAAGERVVTRGAPLIRLAALSPQTPAHGHTH